MARCTCGAELSATSLRCSACGRKLTLDVGQAGDYEAANRVDWDQELAKLAAGDLRPARTEHVPGTVGRWRRLLRRLRW